MFVFQNIALYSVSFMDILKVVFHCFKKLFPFATKLKWVICCILRAEADGTSETFEWMNEWMSSWINEVSSASNSHVILIAPGRSAIIWEGIRDRFKLSRHHQSAPRKKSFSNRAATSHPTLLQCTTSLLFQFLHSLSSCIHFQWLYNLVKYYHSNPLLTYTRMCYKNAINNKK